MIKEKYMFVCFFVIGNGDQKSHIPIHVPEDRHKTERKRLWSKEKDQGSNCKNGI